MRVKARAIIRNEDRCCNPGDIFELRDTIAEIWIKNGWVKPWREKPQPEPAAAEKPAQEIEFAVSRRGRKRPVESR